MLNNDFEKVFSKIEPDNALKDRIMDRIEANEMKKSTIIHTGKIIAVAAALTAALATSAFAMSPVGQETISSIIAYFQNDKAMELTSIEQLAKYNEEIGASFSKDGYTLTLDNIAADDNFVHVFYTVKSDDVPFYEGDDFKTAIWSDAANVQMSVQCVINGEIAGIGSNHNTFDSYFEDNYTYKAVEKYNISGENIPDIFKVELYGELMDEEYNSMPVYEKMYRGEELTDDDKARLWYVSAEADKSAVEVESITREINTNLPWSGTTVEKAVFSPFGNQLVVTTEAGADGLRVDGGFALYDENGTCLDVLNTDLRSNVDGSSRNSLEFLKADKDTKQLKFVPVTIDDHGDSNVTECPIGQYPITYKVNNYGSVVVTDIRISDGLIEIDYYKDGFVMFDPGFVLTNDNGENAEPGGKLGCVLYTEVHYDTNSYTARYVYDKLDKSGKPVPMDDSVSEQALRENFTTLGVVEQMYFKLDFDNAIDVDLN